VRALNWAIDLTIYARQSRQMGQIARRLRETADALEGIQPELVMGYLPSTGMLGCPSEGTDPETGWRGRWLVDAVSAPGPGLPSDPPGEKPENSAADQGDDPAQGR